MLTKTMAILLGIIERKPVNAYELNKWLSNMNVQYWHPIAASTVYATMKTAEKRGYITGNAERSGNMPEKTVYSITETGRAAFLETVKHFLADFDYDITPFHIGMFFVQALGSEETVQLLEGRMVLLKKYQQALQDQLQKIESSEIPPYIVLNIKQDLYIVEAQLKGADEILTELTRK